MKKSNACDVVSFILLHRSSTGCVLIYFTQEILPESGFPCSLVGTEMQPHNSFVNEMFAINCLLMACSWPAWQAHRTCPRSDVCVCVCVVVPLNIA